MSTVGHPAAHDAARLHVTGAARYVDDIPDPQDVLHLAFGLSTRPRASIRSCDLDEVRNAPGVRLVIAANDLPGRNDVSPSPGSEPLLADGHVHYVGQPIFIVAADTHLAARRAARRGEIVYADETPILTIDDAISANWRLEAPLIYGQPDAETAIGRAPVRIDGQIDIGGQEHFYLEGQAAMATPLDDDCLLVNCSSQHPTEIQHKVADAIGVPMNMVRVEVRRMGGAFGGKESQGNALACACAVAARASGRVCRMRYDRDDDMVITGKRHDFRICYKAGFDHDGRVVGVSFRQFARCGWSQDLSLPVCDRAMLHADNAYHVPALRVESHRLRTNTQSATAFRGFGGPQGMLGIERVMDHAASVLGLDPSLVRARNFYPAPPATARTHYGMTVEDCEIGAITDDLVRHSSYRARRDDIRQWNQRNESLKRGLALTPVKFGISFTLTHLNQAGALVHVYSDGSIRINHGGTEMGQGLFVKVAQIAAAALGQPLAAVRMTATDTGLVPNSSATAASSGTDLNGMAVKRACDTIIERIANLLAELHQAAPAAVKFGDGCFTVGREVISFSDAVQAAYRNRVQLSATGFYATPKVTWDRSTGTGRPFYYFAYGAAVSEVVIDTLTGENRVLRADILHDAGHSLNPAIDLGQIEGGYVQGAGWLTTEELVWDRSGHLKTHAPSTYKIPACSDRPAVFNARLWQSDGNREDSIHRSKAVGEPPLMLGISAFLALSDAIAACGDGSRYPSLDAPATPERILAAVRQQRAG